MYLAKFVTIFKKNTRKQFMCTYIINKTGAKPCEHGYVSTMQKINPHEV